MTPALRWAAMRAILMFHNCDGQSHKTLSTDHNFWRERRSEEDSNRGPSAYQPNTFPLGQTGSQECAVSSLRCVFVVHLKSAGKKRASCHTNSSNLAAIATYVTLTTESDSGPNVSMIVSVKRQIGFYSFLPNHVSFPLLCCATVMPGSNRKVLQVSIQCPQVTQPPVGVFHKNVTESRAESLIFRQRHSMYVCRLKLVVCLARLGWDRLCCRIVIVSIIFVTYTQVGLKYFRLSRVTEFDTGRYPDPVSRPVDRVRRR